MCHGLNILSKRKTSDTSVSNLNRKTMTLLEQQIIHTDVSCGKGLRAASVGLGYRLATAATANSRIFNNSNNRKGKAEIAG